MKKLLYFFVSLILMLTAFSITAFSVSEGVFQVTGLTFVKGEQDAVTFKWDEAAEADFYYVYQYNSDESKYKLVSRVREETVTVDNLESGTSHYFKVVPMRYEKGRKVAGKQSRFVACVTAPKGDLVVKTADITEDSITLKWNKIAGATGYKVFIYDKTEKEFVSYKTTKETQVKVGSLKKNTAYKFKVRAYRRKGDALAYGESSEEYKEYTHTDGTPKTKAQIAKAYNTLINGIKEQKNFTVWYEKEIDTEMLTCSKKNLELTVKNTLNLFDGRLNKKYKFTSGKSGSLTPDKLFEPYSAAAQVERDDISAVKVNEAENGYTALFVLKSDSGDNISGSYCDGALSLIDPEKLDTTPLKIKTADSYYDKATISFSVRDGKLKALKIRGAVLSDIGFQVSTVSSDTVIAYSIYEYYKISY